MAMRLFTKKEFEEHLRNQLDLEPTGEKTSTTHVWKTKTGYYVLVPVMPRGERYPDYLLNDIYKQVSRIESES